MSKRKQRAADKLLKELEPFIRQILSNPAIQRELHRRGKKISSTAVAKLKIKVQK